MTVANAITKKATDQSSAFTQANYNQWLFAKIKTNNNMIVLQENGENFFKIDLEYWKYVYMLSWHVFLHKINCI